MAASKTDNAASAHEKSVPRKGHPATMHLWWAPRPLAAARAGMVLLIDGFIVSSAALVAARLEPAFTEYCIFCHHSAEPGHRAQLAAMKAEPLINLGLRLGEGTGAALAYPLVLAAVNFLNEMASFESAGVSDKC